MDELEYIKKIERDVDEVKKDVKALMLFMAVEKAADKARNTRSTIIFSSIISVIISAVSAVLGKVL